MRALGLQRTHLQPVPALRVHMLTQVQQSHNRQVTLALENLVVVAGLMIQQRVQGYALVILWRNSPQQYTQWLWRVFPDDPGSS
jgi:hypothetical protein